MSAFREEDKDLFFGRETSVERLFKTVQEKSLVAVTGSSGSGKSSVVFAGLFPRLKQEGNWRYISFRPCSPNTNPFSNLVIALEKVGLEVGKRTTKEIIENLQSKQEDLSNEIGKILRNNSDQHLLLFIDQFEELYKQDINQKEQAIFIEQILNAIKNTKQLTIVFTIRADFWAYVLSDRDLTDALQDADVKLAPMNRIELQDAIEKPAHSQGVQIEAGLTDQMLNTVEGKPGNLPLVEFALTQLWEKQSKNKLTNEAYQKIGGVENALAKHAQKEYENLNQAEQLKAKQIFIQLVDPGQGTEDTRRLATRSEVGTDNWDVVAKLADARLVVTGSRTLETTPTADFQESNSASEETVEVIHETLITKWKILKDWIDGDRTFRTWQERLRSSMRQWKNSKNDRGALLRGSLLEEAKEKLDTHLNYLSDEEKKYIKRSWSYKKQKEFISFLFLVGSATLFAISYLSFSQAKEAQDGTKLEQAGVNALFQFKSGELSSLVSAMQSAQDLQKLIGNRNNPKDYPAVSPVLALQKILDDIHEQNYFEAGQGEVKSAVFLPGDKGFITAGEGKENKEDTLQMWNLAGKKEASLKGHEGGLLSGVNAVSVGGNAQNPVIASAGEDGTVRLWDKSGRQTKQLVAEGESFSAIAVSLDGQKIIAGQRNGTVYLWDKSGKQLLKTWAAHGSYITTISFSKDGQTLATAGGEDGLARIWTVTGNKLGELKHPQIKKMLGVSLSPDGKFVATASDDNRARIWTVNGQEVRRLEGHQGWVTVVNFSPDGQSVATGSNDGSVKLWNAKTGDQLQDFRGHRGVVLTASFSRDGKRLVSTGRDGFVRLWNLADRPVQRLELTGFKDDVNAIAFSPDGKTIAGAGDEGVMRLWDAKSGKELKVWKEAIQRISKNPSNVQDIAFSPDGKFIVAGGLNVPIARVWNLKGSLTEPQANLNTNKETQEIHQGDIMTVAVSPDSQLVATGSSDNIMRIWKPKSPNGELVKVTQKQENLISTVLFAPDKKQIVTADGDGYVAFWDLDGNQINKWKKLHQTQISGLAITPDGNQIVTADKTGNVKISDRSAKQQKEFFSYQSGINELAISPDGKLIATGGMDGTVRLWDFQGRQVAEFRNPKGAIWGIAFSPNSLQIALAGDNGFVSVRSIDNLTDLMQNGCTWLKDYLTLNSSEKDGLKPPQKDSLKICNKKM